MIQCQFLDAVFIMTKVLNILVSIKLLERKLFLKYSALLQSNFAITKKHSEIIIYTKLASDPIRLLQEFYQSSFYLLRPIA